MSLTIPAHFTSRHQLCAKILHALHSGLAVFLAILIIGGGLSGPGESRADFSSRVPAQTLTRKERRDAARARAHQRLLLRQLHRAAKTETKKVVVAVIPFPSFLMAVQPVSVVPNWGAMRTPEEWNRSFRELQPDDFVPVPSYEPAALITPIESLIHPFITAANIPLITAKLYYSTRFMGRYDLDAGEYSGGHMGVDLKLAAGTPFGAIGGGRVAGIETSNRLGLHVTIEHRIPDEGTFYSIYGHMGSVSVQEGETVTPGQTIGTVGMTGETTGPHIHLQVDIGHGETVHEPYFPGIRVSLEEALRWTVNPMTFIQDHQEIRTVTLAR